MAGMDPRHPVLPWRRRTLWADLIGRRFRRLRDSSRYRHSARHGRLRGARGSGPSRAAARPGLGGHTRRTPSPTGTPQGSWAAWALERARSGQGGCGSEDADAQDSPAAEGARPGEGGAGRVAPGSSMDLRVARAEPPGRVAAVWEITASEVAGPGDRQGSAEQRNQEKRAEGTHGRFRVPGTRRPGGAGRTVRGTDTRRGCMVEPATRRDLRPAGWLTGLSPTDH